MISNKLRKLKTKFFLKMPHPLVSIIIPTFNRAYLMVETLESVIAQTYQNWECIVVDDGSSDYTEELMKFYCEKDDRFQFYQRPKTRKKGASACRNYGLEKYKGEYVQYLDSDDLLDASKFTEQLKVLKERPPLSLPTCKWGSINSSINLRFKTKYNSYKSFNKSYRLLKTFGKYDEYFPLHVYLIARRLIEKSGWWNEGLSHNDDGEYFTRIILNSSEVVFCEGTVVYYRAGNKGRLSILDTDKKINSAIESWQLIEDHLKEKCPESQLIYVKNGKRNIYHQIKEIYPEIIHQHSEFFSGIFSVSYQISKNIEKTKIVFISLGIRLKHLIVKTLKTSFLN